MANREQWYRDWLTENMPWKLEELDREIEEEDRAKEDGSLATIVDAGANILDALSNIAGIIEGDKIFTFQGTIVIYRVKGINFDINWIEQRLREILTANPNADLVKLQYALHIQIVDVQRKSDPAPDSRPNKKPGIQISFKHE